ncbi:MAG: sigma-70 family RNA polymerase sigma factor [Thiotrichales bacterium]|nr:sigma-70 family RNA polymerase sigma factor [Thiotrichales bacterium]
MIANTDPGQLIRTFCEENDVPAFNRFYRQQSARLWRFLRVRGSDEETAYDLVAEAFTRFVTSVCKDPSSPVGLLYRIAINLHIDSYRRASASPVVTDNTAQEYAAASGTGSDQLDQMQLVRHYLGQLSGPEQKLLLMRYWIGLTHKEIAATVDQPEGTVRRQSAAALKKLRTLWQADET